MKKIITTATLIAAGLAISSASFATLPKASGAYTDLNIGWAKVSEDVSGSTKTDNTGTGINWNVGYKFNPNFGTELGFLRFPNEDFGNAKGKNNYGLAFDLKGLMPLTNDFNIFGKFGFARMYHHLTGNVSGSGSHAEYVVLMGVGGSYSFTNQIAAQVQTLTTVKNENVPTMYMVTAGVAYIF